MAAASTSGRADTGSTATAASTTGCVDTASTGRRRLQSGCLATARVAASTVTTASATMPAATGVFREAHIGQKDEPGQQNAS